MGVGCDSLALVSIVPDCAAITQNVMTAKGAEGEDHLCLVCLLPLGVGTQERPIFSGSAARVCARVYARMCVC